MTIEELPNPSSDQRPDSSAWATSVLTLGAGVLLGVVIMWAIGPETVLDPAPRPTQSAAMTVASDRASPPPRR